MVGQTISHYRIIEKLGEGGMGVVYRAEDTKLRRTVALKFLAAHAVENRERLLREAQAAAVLSHPNICVVHEIDEHNGFLAMEYIDGVSLKEKIAARPLSLEDALEIAVQICAGLQAAHDKGIVHRDIKPANLLLTAQGRVKITDFGLAHRDDATRLTAAKTRLGTPAYMSPEQTQAQATDRRTDIWSLGVVLYEMIAGQSPFQGENEHAISFGIVHQEVEPLSARRTGLPLALDRVIAKVLAKAPDRRYQHVEDLMVDLRALQQRTLQQGEQPRRRSTARLYASVFAAVLILLAGLAYFGRTWVRPPRTPSIAVLPLDNVSGDPNEDYFSDGMTDLLIGDLGGIGALRVVSRTSIMQYKNSAKPLRQIARELDVTHALEGSVLRAGGRARITARLLDAAADQQLWAGEFERDMQDVLRLQRDVARQIAREIRIRLTPMEDKQLAGARAVAPEAYEAYLKGRLHWNKRTAEGLSRAIDYLQQAVEIDPNYAAPHALLADSYALLPVYAAKAPREVMPKAQQAVARALTLDDALAEAHASVGYIKRVYEWDWTGAETHLKRAMLLNPNHANSYHRYANFLFTVGRAEEALVAIRRAEELDPLSVPIKDIVGYVFFILGRYDEALRKLQNALEIEPESPTIHRHIGEIYSMQGKHAAAITELQTALKLSRNDINVHAELGVAFARAGRSAEANLVLARLQEQRARGGYAPAYKIAQLLLLLGQEASGYRWLTTAVEERDSDLRLIQAAPQLRQFHADPRFVAILKRMGLR